jgi:hypothetical protein
VLTLSSVEWALVAIVLASVVALGIVTDEWIALVGVGATVLGLVVAIRQIVLAQGQIVQTLSVAQATRKAMTKTKAELARSEMIALIPRLQEIDRGLGAAARGSEASVIGVRLADWRDSAYEFIGLLEGSSYATDQRLDDLHVTAKQAAHLVVELPEVAADARVDTKQLRADISGVCGRLGILHSKLKLSTEEDADGTA